MFTFYDDPIFLRHLAGSGHPECPERLLSTRKGVPEGARCVAPNRVATDQELTLCHSQEYIDLIQKESQNLPDGSLSMLSTGDVIISNETDMIARRATGAGFEAADFVLEAPHRSAFLNIRPPGHHATTSKGMGFCLYNHVALAARYLQTEKGLKRIAIFDFDVHHGNGTQDIFYDDPSIFYFSTHQKNIYPFMKFSREEKIDHSKATIVNLSIARSDIARHDLIAGYKNIYNQVIKFKPDIVLISAGFDAHKDDPIGGLNLEAKDFSLITQHILAVAKETTTKSVISFLEGGYNLTALRDSVKEHLEALIQYSNG